MKRFCLFVLTLAMATVLAVSCAPDKYTFRENSWVVCFYEPSYGFGGSWGEEFDINLSIWGAKNPCTPWSDKEEFRALCQKHGDVGYDAGKRVIEDAMPGHYTPAAVTTNINAIEVVAPLDDFDAEHPAGTSLNDLITVKYATLQPFINDGYTKRSDYVYIDGYQLREQALVDITAEDLKLVGSGMALHFATPPTPVMKIFIQITITDVYGQKHVLEKNIFNDNYEYKQPGNL